MKDTVAGRIEAALQSSDRMLGECSETKNRNAILASLSSTHTVVTNLIESLPKGGVGSNGKLVRALSPVKKSVVALGNAISGLHSGVESRDLTLSKFRESLQAVRSTYVARAQNAYNDMLDTTDPEVLGDAEQIDTAGQEQEQAEAQHPKPSKRIVLSGDLRSAMRQIKPQIAVANKQRQEQQDREADDDNVYLREQRLSDEESEKRTSKEHQSLKDSIEHVRQLKGDLPIKLKHMYEIVRLPIVPIFEGGKAGRPSTHNPDSSARNFSNAKMLEKLGIQHLLVQDYLILENQQLLAINMSDVDDYIRGVHQEHTQQHKANLKSYRTGVKRVQQRDAAEDARREAELERIRKKNVIRKKKGLEPLVPKSASTPRVTVDSFVKPKKVLPKITPSDFAKSVLEVLNEKAPSKYVLVSNQSMPNPRNAHILFFWIMPQRTLSALIRSGWKRVAHWGFPW